jgi:hypothetical protein
VTKRNEGKVIPTITDIANITKDEVLK